jgi:hypothetical protein
VDNGLFKVVYRLAQYKWVVLLNKVVLKRQLNEKERKKEMDYLYVHTWYSVSSPSSSFGLAGRSTLLNRSATCLACKSLFIINLALRGFNNINAITSLLTAVFQRTCFFVMKKKENKINQFFCDKIYLCLCVTCLHSAMNDGHDIPKEYGLVFQSIQMSTWYFCLVF